MIGKVARVVENKGFCFLETKGQNDHFLHKDDFSGHWDDLVCDFHRGQSIYVEFDSLLTAKGNRATNATRTGWPNASAREVTLNRNGA